MVSAQSLRCPLLNKLKRLEAHAIVPLAKLWYLLRMLLTLPVSLLLSHGRLFSGPESTLLPFVTISIRSLICNL